MLGRYRPATIFIDEYGEMRFLFSHPSLNKRLNQCVKRYVPDDHPYVMDWISDDMCKSVLSTDVSIEIASW